MIRKDRLYKILHLSHISEKSSKLIEKNNFFTVKVDIKSDKTEIKQSIEKIFHVLVEKVRTLIVKGKKKKFGKSFGSRKTWKKAYIKLKKGQNLNLVENK
ncbi:50S ribosomal protein L23 [Candidatus Riesia pediculischaeffi]|uniref:Large ribosomal subunit protein uL23 n=2 Tax=Candidatus Riesia pediculischaeffi TaxID=428411 RepID=A0A1V0HK58_9ENTR|nr:50S ribosomal protein L23 [Candidatus Riesia pediculischaeffi]ARC53210.1 50S ribosomal protein L23 [Candidatus Riesia pediculischaeffi]KIE64143.1 LSU ribosomal protein L23p (L23Ae) [Candidatus Riesia pediculischaeffi PTSU]